jgi:hypothetical protein
VKIIAPNGSNLNGNQHSVINTLIKAVEGGELDAQLAAIRAERQFLPSKSANRVSVKQRH